MRILMLNQFFWPDIAATSQLLTDLARHLKSQNHDVTVICAPDSYGGPDCTPHPGVRIVHVRQSAFGRGRWARPMSYLSFLLSAIWEALRTPKPDMVITLTTPPLLGIVGMLVQKLRGARHQIWEMDIYPDVAVDLKVLSPGSVPVRVIGFVADFVRRRADGIIVLGECMRARLAARGISPDKIHVAENWADGELLHPVAERSEEILTLIYPGNLGLAHDTKTIACAMEKLKSRRTVRFLFVGGGPQFEELQNFCKRQGIESASFVPYCSRDRLNEFMSSAAVGLAMQNDACLGSLVPSKVYSLMAAGLPLLFIGPSGSTVANMVRFFGCGWHISCGDDEGLVQLISDLDQHRQEVAVTASRSRQAFLAHYDKTIGVQRICNLIGLESTPVGTV